MEIPTPPAPTSKRPESFEDAEARRCAYQNVSQVEMEAKMARKGHAETKPCDTSAISEGGDLEKKQGTTAIPKSRTLPKTLPPSPAVPSFLKILLKLMVSKRSCVGKCEGSSQNLFGHSQPHCTF